MLPHFVWEDFRDVLFEMRQAGFPFRESGSRALRIPLPGIRRH